MPQIPICLAYCKCIQLIGHLSFAICRGSKWKYIFAVCVITFEPIKIQSQLEPHNDHLTLSFSKNENITSVSSKLLVNNRNGQKRQLGQEGWGGCHYSSLRNKRRPYVYQFWIFFPGPTVLIVST